LTARRDLHIRLVRSRETADIIAGVVGRDARQIQGFAVDVGDWRRSVAENAGDWPKPLDYLMAKRPEIFEKMRARVITVLLEMRAATRRRRVLV